MLKKFFLLHFFLFIFSVNIYSQNKSKADSLENLIIKYTEIGNDSLLNNALIQLFSLYKSFDKEKSLYYCKQGIELGKKTNNHRILFGWYARLGFFYENLGIPYLTQVFYQKAMVIGELYNIIDGWTYVNFGNFYYKQRDFQNAIKYYKKSIEKFKEKKQSDITSYLYGASVAINNIGMCYEATKDYEKALQYYKKGYKLREQLKRNNSLVHSCLIIGDLYRQMGLPDSALFYYKKGLEYENSKNKKFIISIYLNMAEIYLEQRNINAAIKHCQEAELIAKNENTPIYLIDVFLEYSEVYCKSGQYQKSLDYALEAKNLADSLYNKYSDKYLKKVLKQLIHVNEKLNNLSAAYNYQKKLLFLIEEENRKQYSDLQLEETANEIINLKQNISVLDKKNKEKNLLIILSAFLFATLVFLFYTLLKKYNKDKKILEEKNRVAAEKAALSDIIKKSLDEKLSLEDFLQFALTRILNLDWLSVKPRGAIFLKKDDGNLRMVAMHNIGEKRQKACAVLKPGECLCGKAFAEKKTIYGELRSKFETNLEQIPHIHLKKPIMLGDEIFGLLNLYVDKKQGVQERDLEFLDALCNSLAGIIKQKLLEKQLIQQKNEQKVLNQRLFAQSLEVDQQNVELLEKEKIIEQQLIQIKEAHKNIMDSINYAKTIQDALLPSNEVINKYLRDYFILYRPRDKVGGDFYYVNKVHQYIIIAVADCTGHGIPGAFLTMLGITYLHGIVRREETDNAGKALDLLRERFKNIFKAFGSNNSNGLDIALCAINTQTNILQYAGAYHPLLIIRDDKLIEYKATRNPVGFYPKETNFKNNTIQLYDNDLIYMFTDGFQDQLSQNGNKKFKLKRFKDLLLRIHNLPMKYQKRILNEVFEEWKGSREQTDDVLVFGLKFSSYSENS